MELVSKEALLEQSRVALGDIYDQIASLPNGSWDEFPCEKTALVVIDMVNGFVKYGPLSSPRVEGIIPPVVKLMEEANKRGIKQIAFADCHDDQSPEFMHYPAHCLSDTTEAELIEEIADLDGYMLIKKNSTNGFLAKEFQQWLDQHKEIEKFILIGDCTDICVMQFALTLKCWFNEQNRTSDIVVPLIAVETFDLGSHNGDLMNLMALNFMMAGGIRVVRELSAL